MRVWTYGEVKSKVLVDADLQDDVVGQEFVQPDELVGYFNEAIAQAEADILKIHEDYFLTHDFVALVNGTSQYSLPSNIYAMKIRGIVYANGSIIYPVKRIRDWSKFDAIALINFAPTNNEEYQYFIRNDAVDNVEMELVPPAYETSSTIMKRYYIREATRIPLSTETVDESVLAAAFNGTTDKITVAKSYQTGDTLTWTTSGTLDTGLAESTTYYVIRVSATVIQLAASLSDAQTGIAVDLIGDGAGTQTLQLIVTATIQARQKVDLPQFVHFIMQHMRCQIMKKEGDPRLEAEIMVLQDYRKRMIETLTQMVPDNDDTVQADLSHYSEMS